MTQNLAVQKDDNTNVATIQQPAGFTPGDILFNPGLFERINEMASYMSECRTAIPVHLRKSPGDCLAIIMQSMQWRMDPFAVALKTYQVKQGAPMAYEGQLINAVIIRNAPIVGRPEYEFFGPWENVQGKLKIMQGNNGKYAVPNWSPQDEEGVGVTVSVKLKDGTRKKLDVLLKQCWPRNSTNWANDPQQQICYAAIRKLARRDFPDVIMGVYTPDEMEYREAEIDITAESSVVTGDSQSNAAQQEEQKSKDEARAQSVIRADFLQRIGKADSLEALADIGKELKNETDKIQSQIRPAYSARLKTLKEAAEKEAAAAEQATEQQTETHGQDQREVIDKETGEVSNGGEQFESFQQLASGADSIETLNEVLEEAGKVFDKRTAHYKQIKELVELRIADFQAAEE